MPVGQISVGKTYRVAWNREDFEVVVRSRAIREYDSWECTRADNQMPVVLPPKAFQLTGDSRPEVIPPASDPVQS
jgi:hypothetical protein